MTAKLIDREPTQEMVDAACGKWSERSGMENMILRNRFTERWKRAFDAAPAAPAREWSDAVRDVAAERERQQSVEGWTPQHDDEHDDRELAKAAACYALGRRVVSNLGGQQVNIWPWDEHSWKCKDMRSNLVRGGALILAEIERMDRAGLAAAPAASPLPQEARDFAARLYQAAAEDQPAAEPPYEPTQEMIDAGRSQTGCIATWRAMYAAFLRRSDSGDSHGADRGGAVPAVDGIVDMVQRVDMPMLTQGDADKWAALARFERIEHLVWHLLDDSEERGNEIIIHDCADYRELCELLPEDHPAAEPMVNTQGGEADKWAVPDNRIYAGGDPGAMDRFTPVSAADPDVAALVAKLNAANRDWLAACFRPDGEVDLDESALRDAAHTHGHLWLPAADKIEQQQAALEAMARERDLWKHCHGVTADALVKAGADRDRLRELLPDAAKLDWIEACIRDGSHLSILNDIIAVCEHANKIFPNGKNLRTAIEGAMPIDAALKGEA